MSDDVLSIMGMAKLSSLIPIGSPVARKEYPQLVHRHQKISRAIPQKKGRMRYLGWIIPSFFMTKATL
ncbi:MAG: hypothetical protein GWN86_09890 [Desulfobacterales bacterium]|nr:hypothetical protein [Desulfobacterales bacterium]